MTQNNQIRSISMARWCAMASEGAAPPVTICLEGDSMRPFIRRGVDPVTIVPLQRELKKGDVVLFTLGSGRYVVHRIWKIKAGMVRTFGDNCVNPEPWFPCEQVLGQVVHYRRNGRLHRLDTPSARLWGQVWMAIHPARLVYMRQRMLAGRCWRKIFPKTAKGR